MKKEQIHTAIFSDCKVLVIGDVMIDRYYHGAIHRQSPEADVPIVDVEQIDNRLGGTANVALNVKSLGANPTVLSIIGEDEAGKIMLDRFAQQQIEAILVEDNSRPTTVKSRLYNANEYVLRFDKESTKWIADDLLENVLNRLKNELRKKAFDVAILQDYNKGFFSAEMIAQIIDLLKRYAVKIAVDPKKDNFLAYKNVDLFKPNLKEITEALSVSIDPKNHAELQEMATNLIAQIDCKQTLITLSENGAMIASKDAFFHCEAHERNILDVSGAGDTVIAMASLLLAKDFDAASICEWSNFAGGILIEKKGVSTTSIEELIRKL